MWTISLWDHNWQWIQWVVAVGISLTAAVYDATTRRIPNALTGPALLAGAIWAMWVAGPAGLADAGVGCVLLATPYVILFLFAGGGAGDAKLMGAIGAWMGIINSLIVLTGVSVAAIALAIGFTMAKKRTRSVLDNLVRIGYQGILLVLSAGRFKPYMSAPEDVGSMEKMPYGVAIFVGVCIAAGGALVWRA